MWAGVASVATGAGRAEQFVGGIRDDLRPLDLGVDGVLAVVVRVKVSPSRWPSNKAAQLEHSVWRASGLQVMVGSSLASEASLLLSL